MITQGQIDKVSGFENLDALVVACNTFSFPFFLGLTILEKESRGRNVYGHDAGGALSGYPGQVTEANFEVFSWLIAPKPAGGGMVSNGVGPMQITFKGFFPDMAAKNLRPWIPSENILYGVGYILTPRFLSSRKTLNVIDRDAFRATAKAYNGSDQYAVDALVKADKWADLVGTADTLVKWSK